MEYIILLISKYGYFILFPIAVVEGPIATIIAGFFVSMAFLNFFLVYAIVVAGDVVGDTLCYAFGRWGGAIFFRWVGPYVGVTQEKLKKVQAYFNSHNHRVIVLSKFIHGIGISGLIVAGSLKVPYKRYFTICFFTSLIQSMALLVIGVLFGHAYIQLSRYLNYFASATIVIGASVVILIILFKKFKIKQ